MCVRSRLSGRVYRYPFGHLDSIVKLLRWEYKQSKRAERGAVYTGPARVATPPA